MDEHYIWLFNKSDNRGLLAGAFLSFLLHLLMFAVMATTSIFYPIAGDTTKIDVVWLYPSFLFGGETDSQPSAQSTPEPPPPSPVVKEVEAPAPPPASTEPPPAPKQVEQPSPPQTTKEEVAPPAAEPVILHRGRPGNK